MKKLLVFFRGYRKESVFAPAFKCLEAIFELLVPLAVAAIIDNGIKENDTKTIYQMCGVMIALGIIGLVCAICAQFFAARAAVGVSAKLRSALFSHIQDLGYAKTDEIGTSTLITRMTGDINSVQTGINMFLRLFMRSPFIVFGAMIMAFTIHVRLALIFAIIIAILAVVVFGIMMICIPLDKKTRANTDRVVGKVRETYTGARVVRAFNKQEHEVEDFNERHKSLTKLQLFTGKISALMNPMTYVLINLAVIVLIRSGAISVDSGEISQGQLIALYNYMSQILVELIKLANLIVTLNKAVAGAHRISDVLDTPAEAVRVAREEADPTGAAVRFDHVSYRYHSDADAAISDISFSVEPGQTVGIIGGTGSGKSTLIHLIPGFYTPTEGNVFINGKNTALYEKEQLRSQFGIVPQRPVLFKGSIRSNLLWGREDAFEEELWNALDSAQASEFVHQKEKKLDEPVAQYGRNFSGGQKQRLTIARALLRRPSFLIFDDSSSALDYGTESRLLHAIKHLSYRPTVFIVSQRTSSIMHADLILVMEDGEIVGSGTHKELLERCEIYREIHRSQYSEGGEQA
ncbi:MAG: ABC transporter ATP-binding protein [Clostridia bacterium]|nr:ABC transporter ATP-binding protein [Clostridia bacterium]